MILARRLLFSFAGFFSAIIFSIVVIAYNLYNFDKIYYEKKIAKVEQQITAKETQINKATKKLAILKDEYQKKLKWYYTKAERDMIREDIDKMSQTLNIVGLFTIKHLKFQDNPNYVNLLSVYIKVQQIESYMPNELSKELITELFSAYFDVKEVDNLDDVRMVFNIKKTPEDII